MSEPKYLLCSLWGQRSGLIRCVMVHCSKCKTALAIDEANADLPYTPICLECLQIEVPSDDSRFGGFAIGGKTYMDAGEALRAIKRKMN